MVKKRIIRTAALLLSGILLLFLGPGRVIKKRQDYKFSPVKAVSIE
jgi:hypothetical protein